MKKLIIAFDGLKYPLDLLDKLEETMSDPIEMVDYVSHFKFNDALHMSGAKKMIETIVADYPETSIFWDLKLTDTNGTDKNILSHYLSFMRPGDIVTVSSICSLRAFRDIGSVLPEGVKIAIVSVLTDTDKAECQARRGMSLGMAILNDALNILDLEPNAFDAVICSHNELKLLKNNLPANIEYFVPGVRDQWMDVGQQSKDRISGIKNVIDDGASGGVLGAQLMKGNPDNNITPAKSRRLTIEQLKSSNTNLCTSEPLDVLKRFAAYYISPKDEAGNFVGPLVAYAGDYFFAPGQAAHNYVGFEYFNFAKVESRADSRNYFASKIIAELYAVGLEEYSEVFLGAPMGGIMLATEIGGILNKKTIFAEKKVVVAASGSQKEVSEQVIKRHDLNSEDRVVIVEDVCNNFSTTAKLKVEIEKHGGFLKAIVCAINRSGVNEWNGIPVISALFIPTQQFTQEANEVVEFISRGEISWNPKQDWESLIAISGV
ncbi:MAG: orotidine 5'-phosphate decarboxylase / HUMPS family protein [Patescibacteria group bacterium]